MYRLCLLVALITCGPTNAKAMDADSRPNVVWIVVDDMSCHFGYQGERLVTTPHVDRLASEGTVFSRAYATAPVCSTFRSAMITGMYQTAIGAHHHRSGRGNRKISLPSKISTVPQLFRAAGYFTSISNAAGDRLGKQDYNFDYDKNDLYNGMDYNKRKKGQPFFAQFHLRGGKLRNVAASYEETKVGLKNQLVDRAKVSLPPYYPDHPVIREDWAAYLDSVNYTDIEVGRILDRLKRDQVLDNTIVFFLTDHGISHARGKQFLYEEGIRIPFLVWGTGIPRGETRDDLVAHIDLAATSLHLAGIAVPDWMQGRPLWEKSTQEKGRQQNSIREHRPTPRTYVVSARDRCDETVDRIRSVRTENWKYIRNYYPMRPYLQPCKYKDAKPFMPVLRKLYKEGKLDDAQSLQLAETRPEEELYDLSQDPWEIHNLAAAPKHRDKLAELRGILANWEIESNDMGRFPEPEAMYDSDMEAVLAKLRRKDPDAVAIQESNVATMKRWRAEGK